MKWNKDWNTMGNKKYGLISKSVTNGTKTMEKLSVD